MKFDLVKKLFGVLDANGNGYVTLTEFQMHLAQQVKSRPGAQLGNFERGAQVY